MYSENYVDFFAMLPDEVLLHIFCKLNTVQDVGRVVCVNRRFNFAVSSLPNSFWREFYAQQWLIFEEELILIDKTNPQYENSLR
jgi:hypothetical protein